MCKNGYKLSGEKKTPFTCYDDGHVTVNAQCSLK
jgi:hypothetical protein